MQQQKGYMQNLRLNTHRMMLKCWNSSSSCMICIHDLPIPRCKWYQWWLWWRLQWHLINRINNIVDGKFVAQFISGDWKCIDVFLIQSICVCVKWYGGECLRFFVAQKQKFNSNAEKCSYHFVCPRSCSIWPNDDSRLIQQLAQLWWQLWMQRCTRW